MSNWTSLRYAVVDVEGNGQRPPDLVELSIVPIVDGIIEAPVSWLVRPDQPITPFAKKIHGIGNEDVTGSAVFAEIDGEVRRALDVDALVAHAAHVDVGVLQRTLEDWQCPETFDTLKLARRLLPGQDSYKLGVLAEALSLLGELPAHLRPHRAEYDAIVCARLFLYLAGRHSLDELRDLPPDGGSDDAPVLF